MIKKLLVLLVFICWNGFSQEAKKDDEAIDSIYYEKTNDYHKQKEFKEDLDKKYSGKEFDYQESKEEKKEEKEFKKPEIDQEKIETFKSIGAFLKMIFPYLLGLVVVLILIKSYLNTDNVFWKFGSIKKKTIEKLVYEDDDNIEETDYDKLLKLSIKDQNFRLATRYYYLKVLKLLSKKGIIDYHKDKTNTEYLFELTKEEDRKDFSYLSYIYDYVWYGEFDIDTSKFEVIENKYKSFIKKL